MAELRIISFEIGPEPAPRLDKALGRDVPEEAALSRSRLARLIAAGDVVINGATITDARARVVEGDQVTIRVAEASEVETRPQDIPLDICYEDDDLIVVNKPAGLVVHPAPGSPDHTLVNALLHHFGGNLSGVGGEKRPGIVHRIDKDTSGLLVIAKSDRAHHGLADQFAAHSAERHYIALCHGSPDPADPRLRGVRGASFEDGNILKITTQLARHKTDRQRQAVLFQGGRHAVTRVKPSQSYHDALALIECRLETGRTHQIRVHLSHAGHALVGDPVYGGRRKVSEKLFGPDLAVAVNQFPRQALHAASLGFAHPASGEWMRFQAGLPEDMSTLVTRLEATLP